MAHVDVLYTRYSYMYTCTCTHVHVHMYELFIEPCKGKCCLPHEMNSLKTQPDPPRYTAFKTDNFYSRHFDKRRHFFPAYSDQGNFPT